MIVKLKELTLTNKRKVTKIPSRKVAELNCRRSVSNVVIRPMECFSVLISQVHWRLRRFTSQLLGRRS
ncbi:hypothetical protein L914_00873 [Phytophthora nicotianae]|uniref:Uncharacterized protein n=1 Tax=Phytophthora nicotianae TaxID=4792 RepID=W2P5Q4_PHYNI|nr:hypothetical protein L914_00873 [Phytophthora nicotianae]